MISQDLARRLGPEIGGGIFVSSVWGQGSKFSFILQDQNIAIRQEANQEELKEGEIGVGSAGSHSIPNTLRPKKFLTKYLSDKKKLKENTCLCTKILVVDDNEYNVFALESLLKMRGFVCDCSNNGKSAVKTIKEKWESKKCS